MEVKEVTTNNYYRKPYQFIDGRNGFKLHGSFIVDENKNETGIVEIAERKNRSSKWTVEYTYKGKQYSTLGDVLKVYESEKK